MSQITELTDQDFSAAAAAGWSVVDFGASWCGPCRKLAPRFLAAAEAHNGPARFFKVDVDQAPDAAERFEITGVPTIIVLHDGQEVTRSVGLISQDDIAEMVNNAVR